MGLGLFLGARSRSAGFPLLLQGVLIEAPVLMAVVFGCAGDPFVLAAPGTPAAGQLGGVGLFEAAVGLLERPVEAEVEVDDECAIGLGAFARAAFPGAGA